ncbi:THO complex subunit 3 [Blastocladiella emersonii ATCC 22665]|nr:THO complex subunit 3 [Blastocladiella emersonii ATCC 22665]
MLHLGPPPQYLERSISDNLKVLRGASWPATASGLTSREMHVAEWSPDGRFLATGGEEQKIRVWHADSIKSGTSAVKCDEFEFPAPLPSSATVRAIAWPTFGPAGEASGGGSSSRATSDTARPRASAAVVHAELAKHQPAPAAPAPAASSSSRSRGYDRGSRSASSSSLPTRAPASTVSSITPNAACDADGFVTGTSTGAIHFWDLRTTRGVAGNAQLDHTPFALALVPRTPGEAGAPTPASQLLLAACTDHSLRTFDPRNLAEPLAVRRCHDRLNAVVVDAHSTVPRVFLGLEDGTLEAVTPYDLDTVVQSTQAHVGPCTAIALDPMRRYVATGGRDSIVGLHAWDTLDPVRMCKFDEDLPIYDLSFNHDGDFLTGSTDSTSLTTWSVEFGLPASVTHTSAGMASSIDRVRWHPTRTLLAAVPRAPRPRTGKIFMYTVPQP